ncbi:MAG: hypothetical protein ACTSRU_04060 [Candidatus Hodarchaeales archaeon]
MRTANNEKVIITKTDLNGQSYEMEGSIIDRIDYLKNMNSLKWEILQELGKNPSTPSSILHNLRESNNLKVPKSTFYHNFRQLRENGIIVAVDDGLNITRDHKFAPVSGALILLLENDFFPKKRIDPDPGETNDSILNFFNEFKDVNNFFNGYIVVGSPDPHGEYRARARDGHYASQLAFTLGRYFNINKFITRLDQNIIAEKLRGENLVIIGGIYTNMICHEINEYLPVRFDKSYGIISKNGIYTDDNDGFICKIKNPYNNKKTIIVLAGLKSSGTKSTILAITKFSKTVLKNFDKKRIVRGYDSGSGKIDSIDVLE